MRENVRATTSSVATYAHGGIGSVGIAIHIIPTGTVARIAPERAAAGAVIWRDIRAVVPEMAPHPFGLGGNSGGQCQDSESEFSQNFHVVDCLFEAVRQRRRRSLPVLVCPLERSSPVASQMGTGFLQIFCHGMISPFTWKR
jgi:hypothetical protein